MTNSPFYRYTVPRCLALLLVAGCSQDPGDMVANARKLKEKGDRPAAVIQLKSALQRNPGDAQARFLLGGLYNEARDGASAEKELLRAQELGVVEGGRVVAELGKAYLLQGEYQKILDAIKPMPVFEESVAATTLALRGRAYRALGQLDNANKMADEADRMKSGTLETLMLRSLLKASERDGAAALDFADQALKLDPKSLEARMLKADIYRQQGKDAETLATYEEILNEYRSYLPALVARASLYLERGKLAEAQADVDAARKVSRRQPAVSYLQALIHLRKGNYANAQSSILEVLRLTPDYPPATLISGAVHFHLGAYAQAEHILAQYLRIDPTNGYARRLLAASLVALNKGDNALEVIKPMLGKDVQDPGLIALAGNAYLKMGEFSRANEYFSKATALDPGNIDLRNSQAISLLGSGNIDQAISELQSAANSNAGSTRADYLLASTYLRREQYDQALEAVRAMEKKQPNNPAVFNLRGVAYLGKKDKASARKSFEQALAVDPAYLPAASNLAELDVKDNAPANARKRFESVLAKDPKNLPAMLALAELGGRLGSPQDYVRWLESAAKAHPEAVEPQLELAAFFLKGGDRKRAFAYATEAQRVAPGDARALDILGMSQLANNDTNSALATFTQMTTIAPKSAQAHYRLATARGLLKDAKGMESSLRTALKLKPDYLDALHSLGKLEIALGHPDRAIKIAREIKSLSPKLPVGDALEGDVLMEEKKYPEAVKKFEAAYAIGATNLVAIRLYMANVRAGSPAIGEALLEQWLTDHPNDHMVRTYLADAYAQTGRPKKAVEQYEYMAKQRPDDARVLNNLASAYLEAKDPRALDTAERAYKLVPDNPLIADTLGWILLDKGNVSRGLQLLEKAAQLAPGVPVIRYHLAAALAKSGDKARAKKELEQVIAGGAKFPELDAAKALLAKL